MLVKTIALIYSVCAAPVSLGSFAGGVADNVFSAGVKGAAGASDNLLGAGLKGTSDNLLGAGLKGTSDDIVGSGLRGGGNDLVQSGSSSVVSDAINLAANNQIGGMLASTLGSEAFGKIGGQAGKLLSRGNARQKLVGEIVGSLAGDALGKQGVNLAKGLTSASRRGPGFKPGFHLTGLNPPANPSVPVRGFNPF